jgi:hypothetical protein
VTPNRFVVLVPGNHKSLSPFTETIGADSAAQGGKFDPNANIFDDEE